MNTSELDRPNNNEQVPSLEHPTSEVNIEGYKEEVIAEIGDEAKAARPNFDSLNKSVQGLGFDPISAKATDGVDAQLLAEDGKIRKLEEEAITKIKEVGSLSAETLQSPEQKKNKIIEKFQTFRASKIGQILSSEIAGSGINMIPFVGGAKILGEAIAGSSFSGKELTGKGRLIHGAVGAASLALDFTGIGEAKDGALLVGKSAKVMSKFAGKLTERGVVKGADLTLKTAQFMMKYPELTILAEKYVETKIQEQITILKQRRAQAV